MPLWEMKWRRGCDMPGDLKMMFWDNGYEKKEKSMRFVGRRF